MLPDLNRLAPAEWQTCLFFVFVFFVCTRARVEEAPTERGGSGVLVTGQPGAERGWHRGRHVHRADPVPVAKVKVGLHFALFGRGRASPAGAGRAVLPQPLGRPCG